MNWEIIPRDEQETLINVDYYEKTVSVYTCRKSTADRLLKKLGEPSKIDMHNGFVSGVTYIKSFFDKDLAKVFSKGLIIGAFREDNSQDDIIIEEDD